LRNWPFKSDMQAAVSLTATQGTAKLPLSSTAPVGEGVDVLLARAQEV
jgi:hypothetical protein